MDDNFYIAGGTLPLDASSYVTREADETLFTNLQQGTFCYVLDTRQMGKSSLMLRTARRLREDGCRVAVLDLTSIGQNLTVDQWYFGLLNRVAKVEPNKLAALVNFWKVNRELGPMHRFVEAIHHILLTPVDGTHLDDVKPLVLFVDEIDAVRSLPFSADELFGGIRECFNRRAEEPAFQKLTFCLLGVAAPTDLVQDTRLSPFNIGRRVELQDFTPEEATPLTQGLAHSAGSKAGASRLLSRILYWTEGHPYLTQRLCEVVAQSFKNGKRFGGDNKRVDVLCRELFLAQTARMTDDNLTFVRNRLLHTVATEAEVSTLLDFYRSVWRGKKVLDDSANALCSSLRLAGVASRRGLYLTVRNRIYRTVFDDAWVRENLPDAELRRQKAAYRQGVMRTGAISGAVVACVGGLAVVAIKQAGIAKQQTAEALRQAGIAQKAEKRASYQEALVRSQLSRQYVEDAAMLMNKGDYGAALAPAVEAARLDQGDPARLAMHQQRLASLIAAAPRIDKLWSVGKPLLWTTFSPDKRLIMAGGEDGMPHLLNRMTGEELPLEGRENLGTVTFGVFSPDGKRLIVCGSGSKAYVWNVKSCRLLGTVPTPAHGADGIRGTHAAWSPDGRLVSIARGEQANVWEVGTGEFVKARHVMRRLDENALATESLFSPDGKKLAVLYENNKGWIVTVPKGAVCFYTGIAGVGNNYNIFNGQWSQDGKHLLVPGKFGKYGGAGVLDAQENAGENKTKQAGLLLGHTMVTSWAEYSPDESRIATACGDKTARVFDAKTGRPATPLLVHAAPVTQIRFSPSGQRVLTACQDGTAQVWDARSGEAVCAPLHHAGAVVSVQFEDENHVLTASKDGTVRLWDIASPPPLLHLDHRTFFSIYDHGKHILLEDDNARLYKTSNKYLLLPNKNRQEKFRFCRPTPGSSRVLMLGKLNGSASTPSDEVQTFLPDVQVWDSKTGKPVSPLLKCGTGWLNCDGERVLLEDIDEDTDGTFRLADATTGKLVVAPLHGMTVRGEPWEKRNFYTNLYADANGRLAYFTPDGQYFLLSPTANTARFFDSRTGHAVGSPLPLPAPLYRWSFTPDSRQVFIVTEDGNLRLWNVPDGTPASKSYSLGSRPDTAFATLMRFSPDGKYAFTKAERGMYFWPLGVQRSGSGKAKPQGFLSQNADIVISPDSKSFVVLNQSSWLWHVENSAPAKVDALVRQVTSAVFSPNSRHVLVIWEDKTAQVCDTATGSPVTPSLAEELVMNIAFSPDGKMVVTGNQQQVIRLWDARTGEQIAPPKTLKDKVDGHSVFSQLLFSPDGKSLLVSGWRESIISGIPPRVSDLDVVEAKVQLLSGQRQDERLGRVPLDNAALQAAWQRVQRDK